MRVSRRVAVLLLLAVPIVVAPSAWATQSRETSPSPTPGVTRVGPEAPREVVDPERENTGGFGSGADAVLLGVTALALGASIVVLMRSLRAKRRES